MSELLYMYGELDPRVRPLVFTVRQWAKNSGLIEDHRPTPYVTNFIVSMLVLFYLQAEHKMLPPLNLLRSAASKFASRTIIQHKALKSTFNVHFHAIFCLLQYVISNRSQDPRTVSCARTASTAPSSATSAASSPSPTEQQGMMHHMR